MLSLFSPFNITSFRPKFTITFVFRRDLLLSAIGLLEVCHQSTVQQIGSDHANAFDTLAINIRCVLGERINLKYHGKIL